MAGDGERGRHRDGEGDGRGHKSKPDAGPEGRDELGIAGDGFEPPERQALRGKGEITLGREGHRADNDDRRQHEHHECTVESERQRAVAAHRNTSAKRRSSRRLQPTMIVTRASSSRVATAAPRGQLRVFRNSSYASVAATLSRRPPMIAGVANALAANENTMMAPDSTPGRTCGSTMRRRIVAWPAPSEAAAFSTWGSSRCNAAHTARTMNGINTCVSATTTPVSVNMKGKGVEMMPRLMRALLMTPLKPPNSKAQPNVRATTEIKSGPSTTSRKMPRQGGRMRLRM